MGEQLFATGEGRPHQLALLDAPGRRRGPACPSCSADTTRGAIEAYGRCLRCVSAHREPCSLFEECGR